MLNRAIVMGRMVRDPELRYTPTNTPVCSFTLAVERSYAPQGQERETDFIDIVAWRHTAEFVSKYFRKGQLVAAEGKLQGRKWKDKFEQNRVSFEIIADEVFFAESRRKSVEQAREEVWSQVQPTDDDDDVPFI